MEKADLKDKNKKLRTQRNGNFNDTGSRVDGNE
jgi:hypothetical protein